jgi:hypothetical protein
MIPASWDPAVRPLTTAELSRALSVAQTGQLLVADVSIGPISGCGSINGYGPIGRIAGPADGACVVGIDGGAPIHRPSSASGVFAFRVLAPGVLGYIGTIDSTGSHGLAYSATEVWPDGQTIVVYAWFEGDPRPRSCTNIHGTDILDPASASCTWVWLSATEKTWEQASADANTGGARLVFEGILPTGDPALATAGLSAYLLRDERQDCNDQGPSAIQHFCGWEILGRISPLTLPQVSPTTAKQTPTPTPLPTGTALLGLAGLIGEGGRPLTTAEFSNAWRTDPNHLAGQIAITKGPIPTGFMCWDAGAADASAPPGTCHIGVLEGTIAPEGYWAVQIVGDGTLRVMGELKMNGTLFVWSPDQVLADTSTQPGDLLVVQSRLVSAYRGLCDLPNRPCPVALGNSSVGPSDPPPLEVSLGTNGVNTVLDASGRLVWNGYRIDGKVTSFFLIRRGADKDTVLAIFNPLVLVALPD